MNLIAVPKDSTSLDVLAMRYRAAFDKTKAGREQWIEGTLELAVVVQDARKRFPAHQEFSRWIERNGLKKISDTDRSALNNFARDLAAARVMLEQSQSISWQEIWRKRPQKRVSESRNTQPRPVSRRTLRERRIPTVMQEDNPPPKPERKFVTIKALTREQIDPDFKGTSTEFATKHGHVTLHTKQEIEHHKHQEALATWLGAMADHERTARAVVAALDALDPVTLQDWQRKSGKAEKLKAWCNSIELACEKLQNINKMEAASQ